METLRFQEILERINMICLQCGHLHNDREIYPGTSCNDCNRWGGNCFEPDWDTGPAEEVTLWVLSRDGRITGVSMPGNISIGEAACRIAEQVGADPTPGTYRLIAVINADERRLIPEDDLVKLWNGWSVLLAVVHYSTF